MKITVIRSEKVFGITIFLQKYKFFHFNVQYIGLTLSDLLMTIKKKNILESNYDKKYFFVIFIDKFFIS